MTRDDLSERAQYVDVQVVGKEHWGNPLTNACVMSKSFAAGFSSLINSTQVQTSSNNIITVT